MQECKSVKSMCNLAQRDRETERRRDRETERQEREAHSERHTQEAHSERHSERHSNGFPCWGKFASLCPTTAAQRVHLNVVRGRAVTLTNNALVNSALLSVETHILKGTLAQI